MSLRQMLFVSVFIINQIYHLPDPTANSCIVLLVVLCALPRILLLFVLRTGQEMGIAEVVEYGDGGSGGSWLTRVSLLSFNSTARSLPRRSCCRRSLCPPCCLLRPPTVVLGVILRDHFCVILLCPSRCPPLVRAARQATRCSSRRFF